MTENKENSILTLTPMFVLESEKQWFEAQCQWAGEEIALTFLAFIRLYFGEADK